MWNQPCCKLPQFSSSPNSYIELTYLLILVYGGWFYNHKRMMINNWFLLRYSPVWEISLLKNLNSQSHRNGNGLLMEFLLIFYLVLNPIQRGTLNFRVLILLCQSIPFIHENAMHNISKCFLILSEPILSTLSPSRVIIFIAVICE